MGNEIVLPYGPPEAPIAKAWAKDAAFEHASVGAFARLSLQLMAIGAPPDLIEDALRAALDEIAHAKAAYALASSYAGCVITPGPMALPHVVLSDIAALVRETVLDGCVGEATAVELAHKVAPSCRVPEVTVFLERIAMDEERRAALAFRTIAWLVEARGEVALPPLRALVEDLRSLPISDEGLTFAPDGRADLVSTGCDWEHVWMCR